MSTNICKHERCPVVFHPEDGKHCCEEGRISRQADVSRGNFVEAAQAINSMLQPILGNVSVNERVSRDCGKAENKQQTQRDTRECGEAKESEMLAHDLAHAGNITRTGSSPARS